MRITAFLGFLFIAFYAPTVFALAPIDLGQGLVYRRVNALPADLPTSGMEKKSALVLDLRYASTDDAGLLAFAAWLGFRTAAQPVFILINAETNPMLLHALAVRPVPPGVVTLGPALSTFTPDVALKISSDSEHQAYDALQHGATVESLIVEKTNKPRFDEATMVKEHVSDSGPPLVENNNADNAAGGETPKKAIPPPQLIDLALQRAVQLHRALLALHKIPHG